MKNFRSGFTLIEAAVVVVIIAFMAALVSGGRELLESSKMNTILAESGGYIKAKTAFVDKYKVLPGDTSVNFAAQNFTGLAASANCVAASAGDNTWSNVAEEHLAWVQMEAAGVINENINFDACDANALSVPGTTRPASDAVGMNGYTFLGRVDLPIGSISKPFLKVLRLGTNSDAAPTDLDSGGIPVAMLRAMDAKIDDTFPTTGRFFTSPDCFTVVAGTEPQYIEENTNVLCRANLAEDNNDNPQTAFPPNIPSGSSGGGSSSGGSSSGSTTTCEERGDCPVDPCKPDTASGSSSSGSGTATKPGTGTAGKGEAGKEEGSASKGEAGKGDGSAGKGGGASKGGGVGAVVTGSDGTEYDLSTATVTTVGTTTIFKMPDGTQITSEGGSLSVTIISPDGGSKEQLGGGVSLGNTGVSTTGGTETKVEPAKGSLPATQTGTTGETKVDPTSKTENCNPEQVCPEGYVYWPTDKMCHKPTQGVSCPVGYSMIEGSCVASTTCEAGYTLQPNPNGDGSSVCVSEDVSVECAAGTYIIQEGSPNGIPGTCGNPWKVCPAGFDFVITNYWPVFTWECVAEVECGPGMDSYSGKCWTQCQQGQYNNSCSTGVSPGACVQNPTCPAGTGHNGCGACVPVCEDGEYYNWASHTCEPWAYCDEGETYDDATNTCSNGSTTTTCPIGQTMQEGTCKAGEAVCAVGTLSPSGFCVTTGDEVVCLDGSAPVNGECPPPLGSSSSSGG